MADRDNSPMPSQHGRSGKTGVFVGDAIVKVRKTQLQNVPTLTRNSRAAGLYSLASATGLLHPRKQKQV